MNQYSKQALSDLNPEGHTSLVEMFDKVCQEHSEVVAFSCLGHEVSYAEIDRLSNIMGHYLCHQLGLQKGDRVAVQLPNVIQYPIVAWAIMRTGLVLVNTNPQYTPREQIHQFNDSGARALIVLEQLLPVTQTVIEKTGIEHVIVTGALDLSQPNIDKPELPHNYVWFNDALALSERGLSSDEQIAKPELNMDDVAVLQYTGGTTGPSKGAMLTHGNLFAAVTMSRQSVVLIKPGEIEMPIAPLPLYHVFGFTRNIVSSFLWGGTSILIPDPRDVGSIIKAMKAYPFSSIAAVNTLLQAMMAHPEFDEVDFSTLVAVISGGTALVKEIADEWYARTGSEIYEGYGLSETSAAATCNRPEDRELGTVGPALNYQQIKIVDKQGKQMAAGEAGEVCLRGPQIMSGYWNKPEATAESIDKDGWFSTGDIGVLQSNGRLKIVDRIKDMILVSGFNVYPNEIEEVVYGHPNITECAAVGVPNDATGEAIKLFVVSNNPQLTDKDIIEFCRGELTAYKIPKQIAFAEDLPKSPAGKILRRELRDV
ncbi:MAG: long-chain acyl-CoA synthetase [Arenicella sp.]|jgi:long-chain acyl-CoA synthetase